MTRHSLREARFWDRFLVAVGPEQYIKARYMEEEVKQMPAKRLAAYAAMVMVVFLMVLSFGMLAVQAHAKGEDPIIGSSRVVVKYHTKAEGFEDVIFVGKTGMFEAEDFRVCLKQWDGNDEPIVFKVISLDRDCP